MARVSPKNRKSDQLQRALEQFVNRTPEVIIAIAATRDGLSVAAVKRGLITTEEDALAVAASDILDMAAQVNKQLEQGDIGRILIEGALRTTIVIGAGRYLALIVVVPADAKLGIAMLSIRNTAKQIAKVYG